MIQSGELFRKLLGPLIKMKLSLMENVVQPLFWKNNTKNNKWWNGGHYENRYITSGFWFIIKKG